MYFVNTNQLELECFEEKNNINGDIYEVFFEHVVILCDKIDFISERMNHTKDGIIIKSKFLLIQNNKAFIIIYTEFISLTEYGHKRANFKYTPSRYKLDYHIDNVLSDSH